MKALSIILILAMLLCALTGCQSGNITQEPNADGSLTQAPTGTDHTEPPTEPPTLKELIATAYCQQYATQVSPKQVSWDSYGEFEGCQIGFVDGPWMYTAMLVDEIVGSYIFNYRQGHTLYVYKDGQIMKLREAYGEGWLSDDTMAQLYVVFQDRYYGKKVELGDGKVDLPTDDSYENLTDDERAIVDLVLKEYYQHNKHKLGVSEERLSMRYYGEFEGCYVGFIDGDGSSIIEYSPGSCGYIGPYRFEYKTDQRLMVYKNGAFLDLYNAHNQKWLSDEAVGQIYEIFQQRYHGVTIEDGE